MPEANATLVLTVPPLPDRACVKTHEYSPPGEMVCGTEQLPCPSKLPNVSEMSVLIIKGSLGPLVFLIVTVNATSPTGAMPDVGTEQVPCPFKLPNVSVIRVEIVTVSVGPDVLVILTM
jgi:hypothetical protein